MKEIKLQGRFVYTVSSEEDICTSITKLEEGLDLIKISWKSADGSDETPPVITITWEFPHDNIQGLWASLRRHKPRYSCCVVRTYDVQLRILGARCLSVQQRRNEPSDFRLRGRHESC